MVDVLHGEQHELTELAYQLGWAKTYMKKYGILNNSERGVCSITPAYTNVDIIDEKEIVKKYKLDSVPTVPCLEEIAPWRKRVAEILQTMDPYSFERLTQRLLRECAFLDVQVTKKSGDGGIDGWLLTAFSVFMLLFSAKGTEAQLGRARFGISAVHSPRISRSAS